MAFQFLKNIKFKTSSNVYGLYAYSYFSYVPVVVYVRYVKFLFCFHHMICASRSEYANSAAGDLEVRIHRIDRKFDSNFMV